MDFDYKYSSHTIDRHTSGNTHIGQRLVIRIIAVIKRRNLYDRFIAECPFGHILRETNHTAAGSVILWVLAREINVADARRDERWFEIGERSYRFGKQEFLLVTGLPFGGIDRKIFEIAPNDPNGLLGRMFNGVSPEVKELVTFLEARSDRGEGDRAGQDPIDDEDLLKLANVGIAFHLFMGLDDRASIYPFMWVLIESTERWKTFPWGTLCYSVLLYCLDKALNEERVRNPPKTINIYGYVLAFQV